MDDKTLTPINPPSGTPATTLALPDNIFWTNELAWSAVTQTAERALDGALHVSAMVRKAGRPIVLEGGERARISRADLRTLQAWAAVPLLTLTLWWQGVHYTVMFDGGQDGQAIQSEAVFAFSDIDDAALHTRIVLRLLTVG
jgi:hypothetical protein